MSSLSPEPAAIRLGPYTLLSKLGEGGEVIESAVRYHPLRQATRPSTGEAAHLPQDAGTRRSGFGTRRRYSCGLHPNPPRGRHRSAPTASYPPHPWRL